MKLLITGVAGFAGSHLLQHVLEHTDWHVYGIDSLEHRGDIRRVNEIIDGTPGYRERFEFFVEDIAEGIPGTLAVHLADTDYIVNMAAESHVDRSISHPVPFMKNNINLMINMLEVARAIKPKAFIQISTDEVYGVAPEGVDHKEWSSLLPSNPYSASKAAQEDMAIAYWRTYNVPIIITNCMNMFGERQDTEKYVPNIIMKLATGQKVKVHGDEDYIGSRFYLHARNHADALLYILQNLPPTMYEDLDHIVRPSRYNVVGDMEVNNLEMAELVAELMGKKLNYELVDFHHTRPGHDRRYALDGSKLASLGWKPPLDFTASLRKTIEWSLKNKEWLVA